MYFSPHNALLEYRHLKGASGAAAPFNLIQLLLQTEEVDACSKR